MGDVEPESNKNSPTHISISSTQLISGMAIVFTAILGVGWYFYTEGVFTPNEEARRDASIAKYAYEQARSDLASERAEITKLKLELSEQKDAVTRLNAGVEVQKAKWAFQSQTNSLAAQIIVACVSASTAGEYSDKVSASEGPHYSSGGGAAAAAAITAVAKPQDGPNITSQCVKVFAEKIRPLFELNEGKQ